MSPQSLSCELEDPRTGLTTVMAGIVRPTVKIGLEMTSQVREIRGKYDETTIVVYQAYSDPIADAALRAGTFVAPFSFERMTWIKPSFLWMMYRSGWATKPGQERILGVRIKRSGFDQALAGANLSHFDAEIHLTHEQWSAGRSNDVVVQWDPERDINLQALQYRAIQIGLRGEAVRSYVNDWIVGVEDLTATARVRRVGDVDRILAAERSYPTSGRLSHIGAE